MKCAHRCEHVEDYLVGRDDVVLLQQNRGAEQDEHHPGSAMGMVFEGGRAIGYITR